MSVVNCANCECVSDDIITSLYLQPAVIIVCLCLSVCLCVRHTFCQLTYTGQTPQRMFTDDSLKYADLRKDVPFGGLDDE